MLSKLIGFLERWSPGFIALVAAALVIFIGFLDWATGRTLSLSVFYLVPVSMVAWTMSPRAGVAVSVFAAVGNVAADALAGQRFDGILAPLWNTWAHLGSFLIVVALLAHVRGSLEHEKEVSRTDFLTGVPNSRAFREALDRELRRIERFPRPLTIVYIDVDRFKEINDRFGHGAGDDVLRSVAASLVAHTRSSDLVARLGGDEFGLLLPETDEAGTESLVRSLSARLADELQGIDFPVTFSAGAVTVTDASKSAEEIIRTADERMYAAKRNRSSLRAVG